MCPCDMLSILLPAGALCERILVFGSAQIDGMLSGVKKPYEGLPFSSYPPTLAVCFETPHLEA